MLHPPHHGPSNDLLLASYADTEALALGVGVTS